MCERPSAVDKKHVSHRNGSLQEAMRVAAHNQRVHAGQKAPTVSCTVLHVAEAVQQLVVHSPRAGPQSVFAAHSPQSATKCSSMKSHVSSECVGKHVPHDSPMQLDDAVFHSSSHAHTEGQLQLVTPMTKSPHELSHTDMVHAKLALAPHGLQQSLWMGLLSILSGARQADRAM